MFVLCRLLLNSGHEKEILPAYSQTGHQSLCEFNGQNWNIEFPAKGLTRKLQSVHIFGRQPTTFYLVHRFQCIKDYYLFGMQSEILGLVTGEIIKLHLCGETQFGQTLSPTKM